MSLGKFDGNPKREAHTFLGIMLDSGWEEN